MKISITLLTLLSTLSFATECPQFYPQGLPTQESDLLLCKEKYMLAYSYETKTPLYTLEYLTKASVDQSRSREGLRYKRDYVIPRKYRSAVSDYAYNDYDLCALTPYMDIDNSNKASTQEAFLMSNIAPQNYKLHRHGWTYLEIAIRDLVDVYKEVYVVTGVAFLNQDVKKIGKHKVSIPTHFYKVVYAPHTEAGEKMWAWLVPNEDVPYKQMKRFRLPVKEMEKNLGITFFPDMNIALQNRLKTKRLPL